MSGLDACSRQFCDDPDNEGCNLGNTTAECKFYRHSARKAKTTQADETSVSHTNGGDRILRLPWTGNSLGLRDLDRVASSMLPTLVGVIGTYNAGKTSLLSLMYLLFQQGETLLSGVCAGSNTLGGWDSIAAHLRWQKETGGPRFV